MANLEAFQKNIETLREAIPELRAVLIGSTEGLPVAHWIAGGADPARVAAEASVLRRAAPRAARRLPRRADGGDRSGGAPRAP